MTIDIKSICEELASLKNNAETLNTTLNNQERVNDWEYDGSQELIIQGILKFIKPVSNDNELRTLLNAYKKLGFNNEKIKKFDTGKASLNYTLEYTLRINEEKITIEWGTNTDSISKQSTEYYNAYVKTCRSENGKMTVCTPIIKEQLPTPKYENWAIIKIPLITEYAKYLL